MIKPWVRFFIALQFLMLLQIHSGRFHLEIYNFSCTKLTKLMKIYDCTFRKVADNHFVFSDSMMLAEDLEMELKARIRVKFQLQSGRKPRNFIDEKITICEVKNSPIENRILSMLINDMKILSDLVRSCPLRGNVLYSLMNTTLNVEAFPIYLPFLNFTYNFEFQTNNTSFSVAEVAGGLLPAKK